MTYAEEKPHILIVDDEEINRFMAKQIMSQHAVISEAKDGQEALEYLFGHHVDLVLLDYHMPGMNGIEVLKCMKHCPELESVPVLILTAELDIELETEVFRSGAADFVRKPFVPMAVQERALRILQNENLKKNLQKEVSRQTRLAEERLATSEQLFEEMVLALAEAIDAKDKYTQGHSRRVAEYSREMALRTGETDRRQRDIYCMGLLHDIGKIGVPGSLINKPSRLSDDEYEIIKSHTLIGAKILSRISVFPLLAVGARSHHERWDGKGYPEGLRGEAIPLEARMIAVADAYDAMTSRRSYRDIMPQERVRQEIARGSGSQFDPRFADVMLKMIDEDTDYAMKAEPQ